MTSSQLSELNTITVSDAGGLARFWGALLGPGPFARRTLWLAVLGVDGRPVPVTVPIDDIPQVPGRQHVDTIAPVLATLAGYGSVVALIARPGAAAVHEDDRRWAEVLTPQAPRWPVCLATIVRGRCTVQPILVSG